MLKKKKKDDQEIPADVDGLLDELQNADDANDSEIMEQENEQPAVTEEISAEEKLKQELAQANDKYLRLYAEFDNFRRRTSKERIELLQTAGKEVIVSLLPVLDDFERAQKAIETATDIDALKEGVTLVQSKLKNILAAKGLKQMDTKGTDFDADIHEAITNIPAGDDQKGKIVDELEKGYSLNDKVVRFAKVVVGS